MTQVSSGGIGRVYGDGTNLILPWSQRGCVVLQEPIIRQFTWQVDQPELRYSTRSGDSGPLLTGPPTIEASVDIVCAHADIYEQDVPDLGRRAEDLTVGELFGVINRKLDQREA